MLDHGLGGKCGAGCPDGNLTCNRVAGHENPACGNTFAKAEWCGDCSTWTCRHVPAKPDAALTDPDPAPNNMIHGILGSSRPLPVRFFVVGEANRE